MENPMIGKKQKTECYLIREMDEIPRHLRRKFIDNYIHEFLGRHRIESLDILQGKVLEIKSTIEVVAELKDLDIYFLICYMDVISQDRHMRSGELLDMDQGYVDGKVFEVGMLPPEIDKGDDARWLLSLVAEKLTGMEECRDEIAQHFAEVGGTVRLARTIVTEDSSDEQSEATSV